MRPPPAVFRSLLLLRRSRGLKSPSFSSSAESCILSAMSVGGDAAAERFAIFFLLLVFFFFFFS